MGGRTLLLAAVLSAGVFGQQRPLKIYWADVEGGGATLIVTPSGESILIDSAQDLDRDVERIWKVAAQRAGLKQIDHVIATHWHADHYGGVNRLRQRIPLKAYYDHGNLPTSMPDDPNLPLLRPLYLKATGGRSNVLRAGNVVALKASPGVLLEVVAGSRQVARARESSSAQNAACSTLVKAAPDETDNANSLAFKLSYAGFTFFDGGDLTRDIEQKLVCPVNLAGTVDIYQTDGHGMDVSNDATFVRSLRPRVVVVNNGSDKGAEPKSMKAIFETPGIEAVWQLHRNLTSPQAQNTKAEYIANREAKCAGQFLEATVDDRGNFTLQAGPDGTPRQYRRR